MHVKIILLELETSGSIFEIHPIKQLSVKCARSDAVPTHSTQVLKYHSIWTSCSGPSYEAQRPQTSIKMTECNRVCTDFSKIKAAIALCTSLYAYSHTCHLHTNGGCVPLYRRYLSIYQRALVSSIACLI